MSDNDEKKQRGIYKVKRKWETAWHIRYVDASGKLRREKAGTKTAAIQLYRKRKQEALEGRKLPEKLRGKPVTISEISKLARAHQKETSVSPDARNYKLDKIVEKFGDRVAEQLPPAEFTAWLEENDWSLATKNRYTASLKLMYRLAEENGKITRNPARLLHMPKENNERVRYLNQHEPLKTNAAYLQDCRDEESRLRAVIAKRFPEHMVEFDIALHAGMRRSEQYGLTWDCVNLERKLVTIARSKHGQARHVPLNSTALAAFKKLLPSMERSNYVFVSVRGTGKRLRMNRHWFEDAVKEAAIAHLTWHDLRHTFASRLVMAGVDIRTVSELMGHKTIQVTMRYAHLAPAHTLAAVEKLVAPAATPADSQRHKQRTATSGGHSA